MGGAAVAAPLDADGSLYWNSASITGLGRTELEAGLELVYPQEVLSSSVAPGTLGRGFPPFPLSGRTRGDPGAAPLPAMGLVYQPEESNWTFGLGIYEVGGFSTNYPASLTNPVLTAQPPRGIGLGALYSQLQVFQVAPTVACRLTDHLSVGFAPTTNLAYLAADPLFVAPPDNAAGTGFATYPSGTHTRIAWGQGFQVGAYYTTDIGWNFGASFKSPQWFEPFRWNAQNQVGAPRTDKFHFDYPLIASVGTSYTGFDRWVFAADFRYIDFKNAPGLSHTGFDALGAVRGLGWVDAFALSLGAQYQLTECLALRIGYSYNTNPIDNSKTFFNVASATIIEHSLAVGASYQVTGNLLLSLTYAHDFDNSITGPIVTPAGTIPFSQVKSDITADAILLGASLRF
jgi:long-chain fatty acid transport protein